MRFINLFFTILKTLFQGICIGMANIIPGVSGSTIAVVFNIYDKFVKAFTFNFKEFKKDAKFVIPLFLGMAIGVVIFAKVIKFFYTNFPTQTYYVFTGLILGSLPMIFKIMIKKDVVSDKLETSLKLKMTIAVIIGIALMIIFSLLEAKYGEKPVLDVLPEITLKRELIIFFAGILGAVAMIIPGISGSLLMLILGVYPIITLAINIFTNFHPFVPDDFFHALFLLLPNGLGVLIGLIGGAKLISIILKKAPRITYAVIFGLLCGSVYTLFPGFSDINSFLKGLACFLCLIAGFAMAYFSTKYSGEDSNSKN